MQPLTSHNQHVSQTFTTSFNLKVRVVSFFDSNLPETTFFRIINMVTVDSILVVIVTLCDQIFSKSEVDALAMHDDIRDVSAGREDIFVEFELWLEFRQSLLLHRPPF